jgi:hypothetical protein
MRVYKNQSVSFSDPLTLTLSRGERGLLRHPPGGEGITSIREPPGFMSSMASIQPGFTESEPFRELPLC